MALVKNRIGKERLFIKMVDVSNANRCSDKVNYKVICITIISQK